MSTILVCGLVNIETTVRVDCFPVQYEPIRYQFFGIGSRPAGVGLNISLALAALGNRVRFMSLTGRDAAADSVRKELELGGIDAASLQPILDETPQSVVLYDADGRRQIWCDLKDVQERTLPVDSFRKAAADADLVCLCNANFSRALLPEAKALGKTVATDVHVLGSLDDEYNADFMRFSDILFMSDERLPESPESFVRKVAAKYGNSIIVVGLGKEGALLYVRDDDYLGRFPAAHTRAVVNTVGAGDALFSSFVHSYAKTGDPYGSLGKAVVFASYKIGEKGAACGFLSDGELDEWFRKTGSATGN